MSVAQLLAHIRVSRNLACSWTCIHIVFRMIFNIVQMVSQYAFSTPAQAAKEVVKKSRVGSDRGGLH